MDKITYGAPRLVDWVAQIRAGAGTVSVHFTGGALTAYGVTPAEFTTENAFIQRVIEGSSHFREGRIIVLRRNRVSGSGRVADSPKAFRKPAAACGPHGDHAGCDKIGETADDPSGFVTVATTCLQDAQAYLQENFGVASHKVRTCEGAQRVASEHGVRFTGGKFDNLDDDNTENKESIE